MSQSDSLAKLIADAGKDHLMPIGCRRVGQSRTWLSDHRYWLIIVEFQPSEWHEGTYLNVGTMWLWRARKGFAFHTFDRPTDFAPFNGSQHFAPLVSDMAALAAQEVGILRERFKSLSEICRYLVSHTSGNAQDVLHAAIAAGLIGDVPTARGLFRRFLEMPTHDYQWAVTLHERALTLASQVEYPQAFRSSVLAAIQECRSLNGLMPDEHCLDFLTPAQAMQR